MCQGTTPGDIAPQMSAPECRLCECRPGNALWLPKRKHVWDECAGQEPRLTDVFKPNRNHNTGPASSTWQARRRKTREMDSPPLEPDRRQHQSVALETLSSRGVQASPHNSDLRANFRPQPFNLSIGNQKVSQTRPRFELSVRHVNKNFKRLAGADSCAVV